MTLVAVSNVAWGALLTLSLAVFVVAAARKKLPGPPRLALVTFVAWALALASSWSLFFLPAGGDWASEVAKRALIFVSGVAVVSAGCFTGLYVRQLASLAKNRTDISPAAVDLYVVTGHWTGAFLICISLALVPVMLVLVIKPP